VLLAAVSQSLESAGIGRRGEARVVVACSGGRDSVALAHATVTLLGARRVILGHVDHAVRPHSAADGEFVRRLAHQLGCGFEVARLAEGPASEARLRALRYRALEEMRVQSGAERILVGHTADDQAETVLFGLIRTTRAQALAGMPAARGMILRPLLLVPRAEVTAYNAKQGLAFLDDPTNHGARYLRSRLRKELLPLIEARYRPGFSGRLAALAQRVAGTPSPESSTAPGPRPPPGWLKGWSDLGFLVTLARESPPLVPPDGRLSAAFDAARIGPPSVRMARSGDRIQPFGSLGHRKLKDLYREAGVPPDLREALPVVEANGEVVWVPGVARADLAQISETTREVWVFSIRTAPWLPGG
jgi:tRNA(Ile)-lysidine synthase